MMKKLLSLLLAILSISLVFGGCGDTSDKGDGGTTPPAPTHYTVTFKQVGFQDVVLTIESGKGVDTADIPTVQPKVGHSVSWESKDLSSVTSDVVVNAVEIPNTYKIFLNWNNSNLNITSEVFNRTDIDVTYGESFTLPTYGSVFESGYKIDYWKTEDGKSFGAGTYSLTKNITITAVWSYYAGING